MAKEGTYYGIGFDPSEAQKGSQIVIDEFNKIGRAADTGGKAVDRAFKQVKYTVPTLEDAFKQSRDGFIGTVNDLKQGIAQAKGYLQELRIQYKDTLAAVNKGGDPAMVKVLHDLKNEIDLQEASVQGLEARYKSMAGDTVPRFTSQIRQVSNEMMRLAAEGKQNTEEYQQQEQKMRKLIEVQRQFTIERRNMLAGAGNLFAGMVNGVQGLMGAYTAASGVVGAFTKDQEKLMQIQTKLQSSMSILMGLQQMANTLNSTSAFRVTIVTKATELWHAWNLRTAKGLMTMGTSAQFARTAAIGLHSALLLLGGAAVIAAIAVISKLTEQQKKAREEQKKWQGQVGQSVSSQLAEYRRLQAEWERCNGSLEKQKQCVDKNREAWEKLGFEVNDTTTYENVAVNNSEAVVNALVARAKAAAYASLAETKYAEAIQLRLAAENVGTKWWQKLVVAMAGAPDEAGNGGLSPEQQQEMLAGFQENNQQKLLDKAKKLEEDADNLIRNGIAQNDIANELLKGLPTTVKNTTGATQKTYEDALAEILNQTDNFRKQLTEAQREGIREAFSAEMDVAKGAEDWETYYKAQRDLAKFNYEQQKADALAAYEATEKEVAAKRAEWQKAGWDTAALDDQLTAAADLYRQKAENIEVTYTGTLRDIEADQKETNDRITADEQAALEKRNQNRLEYLKQYGSFEEKLAATIEDYDNQIAASKDEFEQKMLGAKKNDAIMELYRQYSDIYKLIFSDAKSLTGSLLGDAIKATQDEIDRAKNDGNIQALTELYERLKALTTEDESRNRGWGFTSLFANIGALQGEMDKGSKADPQKVAQYQQNIQNNFMEIGAAASELGKMMEGLDGVLGDIGKTLSSIGENADSIGKAFSGTMTKAEAWSTAISGTIQLIGMVLNSIQANKKAQEEWNRTIEGTEQRYRMIQLDKLDYKQQNIFGVENPYKKAIDGARQYGEAMKALQTQTAKLSEGQVQTGTKKVIDWGNVGKGAATGAAIGASIGSVIPVLGNGIGLAIGTAIGAITGALSKKVVPVFESLQSQYGELFNPDTYELNERLLADYDKLDDDTKQIVDNWQEIVDKAKEAEQQMKDTFSQLSGNIGSQLSDSLVSAFRNGKLDSAIDDFHDKMNDTIEDIVEQMVFSNIFSGMFDDLEKDMAASFNAGGDENIVDDLMRFEEAYKAGLEEYGKQMEEARAYLKSSGYDKAFDSDEQRTASSKSALGASQDSVDESNARLTTIQSHTFELAENTREIKNQHSLLVANTAALLEHVQGIHNDTGEMKSAISDMRTMVAVVKSDVGTIIDKGLKMR
ncbi:MAG: hypothetical protein IJK73_06945 [Bacteroidales bacterium]|nr:hypothetical protein [Bacteroidales bacterium]